MGSPLRQMIFGFFATATMMVAFLGLFGIDRSSPGKDLVASRAGDDSVHPNEGATGDRVTDIQLQNVFHDHLQFARGSSLLTANARHVLDREVSRARASGLVLEIAVASWPDPSLGPETTKGDWDLAQKRNQAIISYLSSAQSLQGVTAFNMADSQNWLAVALRARDRDELGSTFAKQGAEAPLTSDEVKVFADVDDGAIVLIRIAPTEGQARP